MLMMIVPTLRVATPLLTLCVKGRGASEGGIPTRSAGTIMTMPLLQLGVTPLAADSST